MPELPEVETVARGMAESLTNEKIIELEQRRAGLRFPFPENLKRDVENNKVIDVKRRAKYIWMELSNNKTVIIHLGMSGKVLIHPKGSNLEIQKHDHLIFRTESGIVTVLNDTRRFGVVDIEDTNKINQHKFFNNLGPEPLSDDFNPDYLAQKLKGKNSSIKNALMDQSISAGMGNIYVCDSLYYTGVHPARTASSLTKKEIKELVQNIKTVLTDSIKAGGSSLRDYVQSTGEMGYFQKQWAVYGKDGDQCINCDCDIEKTGGVQKIKQSGRASFYCDKKQK